MDDHPSSLVFQKKTYLHGSIHWPFLPWAIISLENIIRGNQPDSKE